MPDGQVVRPTSDLKYSTSGTDYFLYCVAMDWDPYLFDKFSGTDCCVVIKDPDEFARRMEQAAASQLLGWYFHHCPIDYFDTHERRSRERIDNAMSVSLCGLWPERDRTHRSGAWSLARYRRTARPACRLTSPLGQRLIFCCVEGTGDGGPARPR
ncbi:MAG: hypothetical protein QHD01_21630 [Bradyrhizobium sp.]|uniref:hypothetical protein n=1 Tax=Bradyrhizobium sp. TaxID=376 RepID=UPI0029BD971F|nr:hypothetical protein [Bradyrhizobium sp.]MDX3969177.1 hypothetical protein [Bradyrhizobium sp.]